MPRSPVLQIERAVAPIAFPDPALETVLRSHLFPPGTPPQACQRQGGVRYIFNRFDLNGDRQPETLVALLGRQRCGAEGCPLVILQAAADRLVPLQSLVGLQASLVISERSSHGWKDLILPRFAAGAEGPPRLLVHDGARYPALGAPGPSVSLANETRGVLALELKKSAFLVQGHLLPCSARLP